MQKDTLTKSETRGPDARCSRHEHPRFHPFDSNRKSCCDLQCLAGGAVHPSDLRAALRKPAIARRIKPYKAGGLVNEMRMLTQHVDELPLVRRSPDPTDDFLLALSEAGTADYLVTGDKRGLLALEQHKGTRIVSAHAFAALLA